MEREIAKIRRQFVDETNRVNKERLCSRNALSIDDEISQLRKDYHALKTDVRLDAMKTSSTRSQSAAALAASSSSERPRAEVSSVKRVKRSVASRKESNAYSRLMALKGLGVQANFEAIRQKSVVIVGLGGIGATAVEMLTRCGVGKVILLDKGSVEALHMNRLFFRPDQAGLSKIDAARRTISKINSDVQVEGHTYDVARDEHLEHMKNIFSHGGLDGNAVSLVLSCVDNIEARLAISRVCTELDQAWMDGSASRDAMSGQIQFMLPGRTSCVECHSREVEGTGAQGGEWTSSLPTTTAVISGLLVQNSLKHLLSFGQVSYRLGYDSLKNRFPSDTIKPNPDCSNGNCRRLQDDYKDKFTLK